jgi:uncharacterized membrane protein
MKDAPDEMHGFEILLGHLLRWGVLLSAAIVAVGGALYLWRQGMGSPHYGTFRGPQADTASITGVLKGIGRFDGASIIMLGLFVLVATPVARVVLSFWAFLRRRDWLYATLTLVVLGVLVWGLAR